MGVSSSAAVFKGFLNCCRWRDFSSWSRNCQWCCTGGSFGIWLVPSIPAIHFLCNSLFIPSKCQGTELSCFNSVLLGRWGFSTVVAVGAFRALDFLLSFHFKVCFCLDCLSFEHDNSWLFPQQGSGSDSFAANPLYKHQEQEANRESIEEQNSSGLHIGTADAERLPRSFSGQCWFCFGIPSLTFQRPCPMMI